MFPSLRGVSLLVRAKLLSHPKAIDSRYEMKAIVRTKYGSPDVLQLEEVEKPTPIDNQVLVKVHAASINKAD